MKLISNGVLKERVEKTPEAPPPEEVPKEREIVPGLWKQLKRKG